VVVIVKEGVAYYAHAGDSRIYLQSNLRLTRLTKDHSVVQQMVDAGMITEEEAESHPRKNEITQALGTMPQLEVAVCERPLHPANNDILLLCTDGLNGMISDKAIEGVLNENTSVQHKALRLVELANEAGGYDNITVQLIQFTTAVTTTVTIADTMASTKTKKKTTRTNVSNAAKNQKIDPALIVLCLLLSVVGVLFFMGLDQLSDDTISTSELKLEQAAASDEEITEASENVTTAETPAAVNKQVSQTPASAKKTEQAQPAAVKNTTPATAEKVTSSSGGETFITHTVRAGETFSAVARRYNVTNKTLQSWNPSVKDTDIKADATQLRVKVKATHTVGQGDVLDVVSKKYGVSKELIMAANGKTADRASRGEKLIIPFAEKK
jgi:LysM repeat protein